MSADACNYINSFHENHCLAFLGLTQLFESILMNFRIQRSHHITTMLRAYYEKPTFYRQYYGFLMKKLHDRLLFKKPPDFSIFSSDKRILAVYYQFFLKNISTIRQVYVRVFSIKND
jgi:hypothetical protein